MKVDNWRRYREDAAANGQAGAKTIYDDLKARYPGRPSRHEVK